MTALNFQIEEFAYSIGNTLVNIFHFLALFAIGGAAVWSAVFFTYDYSRYSNCRRYIIIIHLFRARGNRGYLY